jgi:hypothetical protein
MDCFHNLHLNLPTVSQLYGGMDDLPRCSCYSWEVGFAEAANHSPTTSVDRLQMTGTDTFAEHT